jgi:methionine--tRNA ligase beta chain
MCDKREDYRSWGCEMIVNMGGDSAIAISDFLKVELRVGTIETCELVAKSDKLLRLYVNFGDKGMRHICSGVRAYCSPEDLVGKKAIFVYNLQPRMMMGVESQGMMLCVEDEQSKPRVLTLSISVPNGSRLF